MPEGDEGSEGKRRSQGKRGQAGSTVKRGGGIGVVESGWQTLQRPGGDGPVGQMAAARECRVT